MKGSKEEGFKIGDRVRILEGKGEVTGITQYPTDLGNPDGPMVTYYTVTLDRGWMDRLFGIPGQEYILRGNDIELVRNLSP